jgi:hypothetical protein
MVECNGQDSAREKNNPNENGLKKWIFGDSVFWRSIILFMSTKLVLLHDRTNKINFACYSIVGLLFFFQLQ